jgi:hypothetical protein
MDHQNHISNQYSRRSAENSNFESKNEVSWFSRCIQNTSSGDHTKTYRHWSRNDQNPIFKNPRAPRPFCIGDPKPEFKIRVRFTANKPTGSSGESYLRQLRCLLFRIPRSPPRFSRFPDLLCSCTKIEIVVYLLVFSIFRPLSPVFRRLANNPARTNVDNFRQRSSWHQ